MRLIVLMILSVMISVAGAERATSTADRDVPVVRIAPKAEPGKPLQFSGRVLDYRGEPLARAAVVAYNANASGLYNPQGLAKPHAALARGGDYR